MNILLSLNIAKNVAFYSMSSKQQQAEKPQLTDDKIAWKKDVVVVPIQTTVDDLKRTHRKCKDGFYVSHRSYIEQVPEKYTIEPILTKGTGGYDIETSKFI